MPYRASQKTLLMTPVHRVYEPVTRQTRASTAVTPKRVRASSESPEHHAGVVQS